MAPLQVQFWLADEVDYLRNPGLLMGYDWEVL